MSSPKVSVCLPVYNGANYLSKAIESVLAQSFEDFELLIANDCSTDNTLEIVEKYAASDKRIRSWTNKQNLKLFGNYNACIEAARGQYIKLFAHDDLFEPELIASMVTVLDENPGVSLVSSNRHWIDAEDRVILPDSPIASRTMTPFEKNTRVTAAEAISSSLNEVINWLGEPSSQMFRKEASGGGYDTAFRQIGDLEFSYRLLGTGDYYFLAERFCYFRRHAESWSTARSKDMSAFVDWFLLGAKYKQYLEKIPLSSEEYCLKVVRALTKNFESILNQSGPLNRDSQIATLRQLCEKRDPLSYFAAEKDGKRDSSAEATAMAAISFLSAALLENELRSVHTELTTSSNVNTANGADEAAKRGPEDPLRAGITEAISSMRKTLAARDEEIEALKSALSEMGNSMSWKVTKPLRALKRRLH